MNDTGTPPTYTPPAPPPPPHAEPPPRPMLRRSATTRLLGGVCGGLSEHTGIDVVLFRVAFVVLTVAGGAGLLLYVALWLLLPDAYGEPSRVYQWVVDRPSSTARNVVLILAGLFVLAIVVDGVGANSAVVTILAVAALAYLWTRERDRHPARVPATGEAAAPPYDPPVTGPVTTAPARPRRQRSVLGRVTISVLLIALGILALVDRQTGVDVTTTGYLATAVGIVGAGLLVGTLWGRSRGLIVLGVPLVILLGGASTFDVAFGEGVGGQRWTPSSVVGIDSSYRYGIGEAELNLSTVDFQGADVSTSIRSGIGYVHVLVPADVDVRVTADVRAGALTLFDISTDADSDLTRTVVDTGADGPGGGQLDLAVNLGLGLVEVTRVG